MTADFYVDDTAAENLALPILFQEVTPSASCEQACTRSFSFPGMAACQLPAPEAVPSYWSVEPIGLSSQLMTKAIASTQSTYPTWSIRQRTARGEFIRHYLSLMRLYTRFDGSTRRLPGAGLPWPAAV